MKSKLTYLILSLTLTSLCIYTSVYSFWDDGNLKYNPQLHIGFPQPLQLGCQIFSDPTFRVFSDIGFIRFPPSGDSKFIRLFNYQVGTMWFPFNSWFFLSGAMGYRRIGLAADMSGFKIGDQVVSSKGEIDLHTFYFAPSFGILMNISERISLGIDFGAQIALYSVGNMNFSNDKGEDSSNSADLATDSSRAFSRIAALLVPQVTLIKLVWRLK